MPERTSDVEEHVAIPGKAFRKTIIKTRFVARRLLQHKVLCYPVHATPRCDSLPLATKLDRKRRHGWEAPDTDNPGEYGVMGFSAVTSVIDSEHTVCALGLAQHDCAFPFHISSSAVSNTELITTHQEMAPNVEVRVFARFLTCFKRPMNDHDGCRSGKLGVIIQLIRQS